MVSFFAKVKIFRFWLKTMDYNKAFLPKSRCFSAVLLLHSGRCYKAEICIILFLMRCPFMWSPFWLKSKFSERASQEEQSGANFSFIAPCSEEL